MADSIELRILSDAIPALLEQVPELVMQIVEKAASDIVNQAQQAAPVDTGALRASIGMEMTGPAEATVSVGVNYGAYVEYGTVKMAAQPYLTPAVEANRDPFNQAFSQIEGLVK